MEERDNEETMKKHTQTIKGYCAGLLTAILISGIALSADAVSLLKEIKVVMGGIQIYVDGNLKKPVDANGNVVEPLIYDGTTYLPVRALTGMLTDKEVSWDGNAQAVYIGKKPDNGGKSVAIDTLKPLDIMWCKMSTGKDAQFNLLDEVISPFNALKPAWTSSYGTVPSTRASVVYKLDSNYSQIHGYFVEPYTSLGDSDSACIQFYSVDQYGEKTLIETYKTKAADAPLEITVPLLGVNILRVEMATSEKGNTHAGCLYDVTLTTTN